MRKIISSLVLFLVVFSSKGQNVGINTNTPHPSAALDITDSTKGILIPRMTMVQRNNIQNPAEGLMVYQTDSTKGFWYWNGGEWISINSGHNNDNNQIDSIDANSWIEIQNITNGCQNYNPSLTGNYQINSSTLIKGFFIEYNFDTNGYLGPACNAVGVYNGSVANSNLNCMINFLSSNEILNFNFEMNEYSMDGFGTYNCGQVFRPNDLNFNAGIGNEITISKTLNTTNACNGRLLIKMFFKINFLHPKSTVSINTTGNFTGNEGFGIRSNIKILPIYSP